MNETESETGAGGGDLEDVSLRAVNRAMRCTVSVRRRAALRVGARSAHTPNAALCAAVADTAAEALALAEVYPSPCDRRTSQAPEEAEAES